MFPLATDFRMTVAASEGYRVGRIYGARHAEARDEWALLASPALFLGHRMGSDDVAGGRRGGGGGLFVELLADPSTGVGAGAPAVTVHATWTAADGTPRSSEQTLVNPLAPGQNPAGMWPELTDEARGNAFMMLNMYLALRASTSFFADGDCARSMGVVDMMAPAVEGWQAEYDNPDIWADYDLMLSLRSNVETQCNVVRAVAPVQPESFSGGCMML
jgi:Ca-activated chloride channel family protein